MSDGPAPTLEGRRTLSLTTIPPPRSSPDETPPPPCVPTPARPVSDAQVFRFLLRDAGMTQDHCKRVWALLRKAVMQIGLRDLDTYQMEGEHARTLRHGCQHWAYLGAKQGMANQIDVKGLQQVVAPHPHAVRSKALGRSCPTPRLSPGVCEISGADAASARSNQGRRASGCT